MFCNSCSYGGFKAISKPHPRGHLVQQIKRWCAELKCPIDRAPKTCRGYKPNEHKIFSKYSINTRGKTNVFYRR